MKYLFYFLVIASVALFVYSAIHLYKQASLHTVVMIGEIKGFEDTNPSGEYTDLVKKFRERIQESKKREADNQSRYFWMSFIVTALTAGSTLVSAIQAAKKDSTNKIQTFAIVVAVLTFCSSLSNFASSHFNDLKNEETKKIMELTTRRNQFFADYDKAPGNTRPSVIRTYAQTLD